MSDETRTHLAEDARDLQYKVELGATGDLACPLRSLEGLRLQLGEQQGQTWIVIVRIPDLGYVGL